MNNIDRNKILIRYMIDSHIIESQKDLGRKLGYTNESSFSQVINGKVKTPKDFIFKLKSFVPNLNEEWMIDGKGEMLLKNDSTVFQKEIVEKGGNNYKLVPLVHIDSVGGMQSNNSITDEPQYIEGYIPFVNAKDDDRAIIQSGTSMIPTIPPGSFMQLREVENWREYFGYGNIFVIELTDGRRITKEVRRYDENPKDYVLCVSHNPDVAPEELPKSMIASVWKVIKILMDKGW